VTQKIREHVEKHKARHKWLVGGVEFVEEVPKSATGKVLRRLLTERERQARNSQEPRL
jgi:acyl-coenzyme A synthetase/AMP-(fatty) acid ligase